MIRAERALPRENSYITDDEKRYPTASRWYHVRVRNDRRMSKATDVQVVLLEVGIPNAAGKYIWQSAGYVPLPIRHEALRASRVVGRPLEW